MCCVVHDLAASQSKTQGKAISAHMSCSNVADKWVTNVYKIHRFPFEVDLKSQLALKEATATLAAYFMSIYFFSFWEEELFDPSGERKGEWLLQSSNYPQKIHKTCKQHFICQINYMPWHIYAIPWYLATHFTAQKWIKCCPRRQQGLVEELKPALLHSPCGAKHGDCARPRLWSLWWVLMANGSAAAAAPSSAPLPVPAGPTMPSSMCYCFCQSTKLCHLIKLYGAGSFIPLHLLN